MSQLKKKILVVEDDNSIREALTALLRDEGCSVVAVANGKEAIEYLRATDRDPCMVLTDLFMPEMNGYELIRLMKEADELVAIPIVVMSANRYTTQGLSPETPYLKKPFSLDLLMYYVKEYCDE